VLTFGTSGYWYVSASVTNLPIQVSLLTRRYVQIWNMIEGKDLFQHIRSIQGDYDVRAHVAEMIALLGPLPKELLDREKLWSDVEWDHAVQNPDGKLCQTAREYFGGPFFNSEGKLSRS
jgi:hypothetical protein